MWLTKDWMVLPFQGFAFDPDRIERGQSVQGWQPELPITLALIPRDDIENGEIRWITADIEQQYVMHTWPPTSTVNSPDFGGPDLRTTAVPVGY